MMRALDKEEFESLMEGSAYIYIYDFIWLDN